MGWEHERENAVPAKPSAARDMSATARRPERRAGDSWGEPVNDVVGNGAPSCGLPTPPTLSPFDVVRERTSWAELAARCGNPFATPEWLGAWRRYLCTDGDFVDCAMRDIHGTPRAVLPLERIRRGPLWIVRFQGCGPTDQVPPVCGPDDRAAVAEALRGAMARGELRADLLVAHGLPADEGWGVALGAARLRLEASPRIALPTTWQEFLAAKSRNFRGQLGARERRLRRTFDVRFRLADNGDRLADDMSTLIRLHDLRWRGASGSSQVRARRSTARSQRLRSTTAGYDCGSSSSMVVPLQPGTAYGSGAPSGSCRAAVIPHLETSRSGWC